MTDRGSLATVFAASVVAALLLYAVCFADDAKPWQNPGAKVGDEIIGPDGGKMVWVPSGEFDMGADDIIIGGYPGNRKVRVAGPVHRVRISRGFWLGKCTVTTTQYDQYCQATGTEYTSSFDDEGDNRPIVCVTWTEATAYCEQYGLSLPTEAQWEYAARGREGREYPWGDEWDPQMCCHVGNRGHPGDMTFPVGSFVRGASWCGALDMAGNVQQWCKDWYSDKYYAKSPGTDPPGPVSGRERLMRGGDWAGTSYSCRSAFRSWDAPSHRSPGAGFRCSVTPPGMPVHPELPRRAVSPQVPPQPMQRAGGSPWTRQGTKVGEEITGPDGGTMVWVPAGEFSMGDDDLGWKTHRVRISKGFWLARCTVTNAQYRRYCQETGARFPKSSDQVDDHPVVYVSWTKSRAYCQYYGLDLPMDAQWEYAARGPDARKYPWGDQWDRSMCCTAEKRGPSGKTFAVGSFPLGASWCGALDMAGNVWQWCRDWYSAEYYANLPDTDPPGPDGGDYRVLRGGSWSQVADFCLSAYRDHIGPARRDDTIGFRCSKTP